LHATALLVDQYGGIRSADQPAHLANERADLIRIVDVARKQNESERLHLDKESPFFGSELQSGAAKNAGGGHAQRVDMRARRVKRGRSEQPKAYSSVALNYALAAGGLQALADLAGLRARAERTDLGAVENTTFAEIDAPD
jgi:hypothetical protein